MPEIITKESGISIGFGLMPDLPFPFLLIKIKKVLGEF
jgi:hypothetical protein